MNVKKILALTIPVGIVIAVLAVALGLGTPKAVQADYTPEALACLSGAKYQIRLYGDTTAYTDGELQNAVLTIDATTQSRVRQKYLVCPGYENGPTNVRIYFAGGTLLYVPFGSGDIVPRYYTDSQ